MDGNKGKFHDWLILAANNDSAKFRKFQVNLMVFDCSECIQKVIFASTFTHSCVFESLAVTVKLYGGRRGVVARVGTLAERSE